MAKAAKQKLVTLGICAGNFTMKKRKIIIRLNRGKSLNKGQLFLVGSATILLIAVFAAKPWHVSQFIAVTITELVILFMAVLHHGIEVIRE